MNWQHFRAFLWLRWRLFVNQMNRTTVILLAVLAVFGVFSAAGLFVTFLLVGLYALSEASPALLMLVWDGLAVAFLFAWAVGLMTELQRSEVLSLDRFLHLPVSLKSAFLINYLSSFFSVTLLMLLPPMLALALGLIVGKGPALLWQLPLLAAFLLMTTALTYQFQGWLASLMANKRRRRTIIVVVTITFILLCQVPNVVMNVLRPWEENGPGEQPTGRGGAAPGNMDAAEFVQYAAEKVRPVNLVLPPGWLALGVEGAAEGRVLPPLLGTLGMAAIGALSLWRSYRTTLRLYTGQFSARQRKAAPAPVAASGAAPSAGLLEKEIPGLPERVAAIALCGLRSLTRAPEAKMMLLSPVLLLLIFGSMAWRRRVDLPEMARPLVAFGAMTTILLTTVQVTGNQFGFDRSGFRVYVLSAAPRRDILMGKNLSFLPIALGLSLFMVAVVEVVQRLRVEHLLATLPEFVCMYLPFCLLGNFLSIFAPMPIRAGSFKPLNPKVVPVLLHLAAALLSPVVLVPALVPLGVELLLEALGLSEWVPVCLILSLLECAAVIAIYRAVVGWQGDLLQARERKILEVVTTRAE